VNNPSKSAILLIFPKFTDFVMTKKERNKKTTNIYKENIEKIENTKGVTRSGKLKD
jgi:hypothetical protein